MPSRKSFADQTPSRFQRYRAAKESRGLRMLRVWVPDTRSAEFAIEAQRQAKLLAGRPEEKDALEFIGSAFDWPRP